jgi:Protein of unknown function (DUF3108)
MLPCCSCLAVLGVFASVTLVTPAEAQSQMAKGTLDASYKLAFWDIPFGSTSFSDALASHSYSAKAHFETDGVIGFFWRSVIDATADGSFDSRSVSPLTYDSYSRYRDRPLQRVKLTFENSDPVTLADPPFDTFKHPVSAEQKKGAIDPMSALISILLGTKADAKNPCGTGARVFDGRRRYDVQLVYLKDEPVTVPGGLNRRIAHLCQIRFLPIAGYPQKLVNRRRKPPKMFADFMDISASDTPNGRYVVPVKLWSELSWGTVKATLNSIRIDRNASVGTIAGT